MMIKNYYTVLLSCLLVSACTPASKTNIPDVPANISSTIEEDKTLNIKPVFFSDLPNWGNDSFKNFNVAFTRSCNRILKNTPSKNFGREASFGQMQEWQIACRKYKNINATDAVALRSFFETTFVPYEVSAGNDAQGLFTGYYEASLKGSRTRQGVYQIPLRARPDDLVMVQLGNFRDELKGQRIAGRIIGGNLKPYESHEEIVKGGLPPAQDNTLVWVDNAVDAFFLQIQGSGIVDLEDGTTMRVGYAGQNGHPYYAIGRELISRGALTKENVSMQSIRAWLARNPDQAQEIMFTNKSYVFFREITGAGPIGGEGLALTPMRSLAIDRSIIPYGMPVWVDINHPEIDNKLMVTQDTGGAIRGPVRGDFFWGHGDYAQGQAGEMKAQGRYWFLMPKTI